MERQIKFQPGPGLRQIVAPGTMRFLDFARLQLKSGERHSGSTGDREYAVDIFAGRAAVSVQPRGSKKLTFPPVGDREDVFSGPPAMVYIPANSTYEIGAISPLLDAGIFSAPASQLASPRLIRGTDALAKQVGRDNWQRTVYSALDDRTPAEKLLVGETLNPSGNWSSYPPHKHDRANPPQEAVLEEIYFFRVKPAQGFGFIWTYTDPRDPDGFSTVFVVEDGDTVLLPKGYHPVVAAPGYQIHYTWALAGESRLYGAWADDPRHAWVRNQ